MYPTEQELAEFCIDAKLIPGFPVDFTPYFTAIESAISNWEKTTGWQPFLNLDEDDTDRVFRHLTGSLCDFNGGFASIDEIKYDDDTEAATEHDDYVLYPEHSYPKRFLKCLTFPSRKITVTGKFGYCIELPDDVKQAILAFGAAQVATQLNGTGQMVKIKQGDVEYQYAEGSSVNPTTQYAQWTTQFKTVAARYRKGAMHVS